MKKYVAISIFMFAAVVSLSAETYKIERLNADHITISGKHCRVGDIFSGTDTICWDNATILYARDMSSRLVKCFRKDDEAENKNFSIWQYFKKINRGSTRTFNDYDLGEYLSNVFYLTDTLQVRIGNAAIVLPEYRQENDLQYMASYQYDGNNYIIPITRQGDLLLFTADMFRQPLNQQQEIFTISVWSISGDGHKQLITNSMTVVLLF